MSGDTQVSGLMTHSGGALAKATEWLQLGGPVVMILLAMSVVALTIILLKLYQFRRVRMGQRHLISQVLSQYQTGQRHDALLLAQSSPNPVLRLLALAIRGRLCPHLSEDKIREEVYRVGADYLEQLRAYMRPLEVIASLAPLLGLFGTVVGMIEAFQQLQSAGARVDPSMLSGGIWQALLTTAVGLAVAIPVVAVVNFFDRILARLAHDMNNAVTRIFTEDLGEGLGLEERSDDASGIPANIVTSSP